MPLGRLVTETQCCLTRRGYLKVYSQAVQAVQAALGPAQYSAPDLDSDLDPRAARVREIMRHYRQVARLMQEQPGLVCRAARRRELCAFYPEAGSDFTKGGALLPGREGRPCLSTPLLVPLIFRRAEAEYQRLAGESGGGPARVVAPSSEEQALHPPWPRGRRLPGHELVPGAIPQGKGWRPQE
ncbi:MAG: hypothetical protein KQJ78_15425 [Deltaproteobacteria bacterium]|nr:hypothetical protein [Deltaproteobacteria bacterium]